ncbi:MAG: AAA family ATPase, partial [Dehalococcoidia bacterium]
LEIEVHFQKSPELGRRYIYSTSGQDATWLLKGSPTKANQVVDMAIKLLGEEVHNTFILSSTRGGVSRVHGTGSSPSWVGKVGQFLVPLLAIIFGKREHEHIAKQINEWAPYFGITAISAGYWGEQRLGSDYRDPVLETVLGLAGSSGGTRQVLCVITQLFWAPIRSIIIIEEPEISLHPESQLHLIDLFAEVIKDEKQILITTHSPILVMALSQAVQKGKLKSDDVAVYHVEKKEKTGTVTKPLPVNSKGHVKGWIPSFAKVERKLLREWAKSLPQV